MVPRKAGMMRSGWICLERQKSEQSGEIGHAVGVGSVIVKWGSGMGDGVDALDRLVKCAVLGDILNDEELKAVTVLGELFVEEGAFRQGANCAADGVACF